MVPIIINGLHHVSFCAHNLPIANHVVLDGVKNHPHTVLISQIKDVAFVSEASILKLPTKVTQLT